jgi:hypothetical protein
MKSAPAVNKPNQPCLLRSTVVGTRRLIVAESFYQAVLKEDPPPGAPLTLAIKEVQRLSGLSRTTVWRLIKAGQAAESEAA